MDLSACKVGDSLFIDERWGYSGRILKIDRLTATQAICGDERFRLDTGKRHGSSGWHSVYARPAQASDILAARIRGTQQRLEKFKVTAENLSAVEAFLKANKP
jgi:hypothetical protein